MGELAGSLAHEITQPIGSARNNAQAALNFLDQRPPDLDEVGQAWVDDWVIVANPDSDEPRLVLDYAAFPHTIPTDPTRPVGSIELL